MSVDFWTSAERFYETIVPVLGISVGLLVIVILYAKMYAKGKVRKVLVYGSLITGIFGVVYGFWGYEHYSAYLPQSRINTPLIRDREPGLFGYQYYSYSQMNMYKNLNDAERLQELSFYSKETVSEPLTYLGEGRYFHYFEDHNGNEFKQTSGVVFETETENPSIIGQRFHLNDQSFEEIGFFEPERIMYDKISIPEAEKGKAYQPDFDPQIPTAEDHLHRWSF